LTSKWVVVAACGTQMFFRLFIFKSPGQGVFENAVSVIATAEQIY